MQGKCSWDAGYHDIVQHSFHIRASARFSDLLRRACFGLRRQESDHIGLARLSLMTWLSTGRLRSSRKNQRKQRRTGRWKREDAFTLVVA